MFIALPLLQVIWGAPWDLAPNVLENLRQRHLKHKASLASHQSHLTTKRDYF